MMTCKTCGGRRVVSRLVPETRESVIHPDGWDRPPVKLTYPTGREVQRNFECPTCRGRGRVETPTNPLMPAIGAET